MSNPRHSPLSPRTLRRSLFLSCLATAVSAAMSTGVAVAADAAAPQAKSENISVAFGDAAITARVKARLFGAAELKQSEISVTTTNGVVTLDGSASSGEVKSFAETATLAVDGVASVDNQLQTPSGSTVAGKAKHVAAATGQALHDSWITTKVKSEIVADGVSEGFDLSVETSNGVVVLKGRLPDQAALDHARTLAQQVKGVKGVDSSAVSVGPRVAAR